MDPICIMTFKLHSGVVQNVYAEIKPVPQSPSTLSQENNIVVHKMKAQESLSNGNYNFNAQFSRQILMFNKMTMPHSFSFSKSGFEN